MEIKINSLIENELNNILRSRLDIVMLACIQRAKFEGWLKFELAIAIKKLPGVSDLVLEDGYPSNGRSDFSFKYDNEKYFVEMKTANTNWRDKEIESIHRPITKNIEGIIEDIQILTSKCPPAHGLAVFTIFPIPERIINDSFGGLRYHLGRIEMGVEFNEGKLLSLMEYIPVGVGFGISTFVAQVV